MPLMYPRGARQVQCSVCGTLNDSMAANAIGHVICDLCHITLMVGLPNVPWPPVICLSDHRLRISGGGSLAGHGSMTCVMQLAATTNNAFIHFILPGVPGLGRACLLDADIAEWSNKAGRWMNKSRLEDFMGWTEYKTKA